MRLIDADALIKNLNKWMKQVDPMYPSDIPPLENCIVSTIMTIEEQPTVESMQWIPCSERLPHTLGCYLVWRPHFFGGEVGMPAICYFDGQNTWHDSYGVDFTRVLRPEDVTAWMPLPAPYKGDTDGK